MYNKDIPTNAGALYKTFRSIGRDCGGNCGGVSLDYYRGIGVNGEWYIIPVEWPSGSDRTIWVLRWIAAQDNICIQDYPDKAIPVYLWKS